jgi:hypothetical protein
VATNIPSGISPVSAAVGTIRLNHISNAIEVWDGSYWMAAAPIRPQPWTWVEWFDYYIGAAGNIPDQYTRQVHIQQKMQALFPGRYRIDLAGQAWIMVFDTPADETWWRLKYD